MESEDHVPGAVGKKRIYKLLLIYSIAQLTRLNFFFSATLPVNREDLKWFTKDRTKLDWIRHEYVKRCDGLSWYSRRFSVSADYGTLCSASRRIDLQ